MPKLPGNLKFHHVGIAVESIEQALNLYRFWGYQCSEPVYESLQNVYLSFCKLQNHCVELVSHHDEESLCKTFLLKIR